MRYYLTAHAISRYVERINNGLHNSDSEINVMLKKLYAGRDVTNKVFDECPRYMLYLYERYESLVSIVESDGIIFICNKRKGTEALYDVITCYKKTDGFLRQWKESVMPRQEVFIKIKLIKTKIKNKR